MGAPHTRSRRWTLDGTFERMLRAAQARADTAGDIDWLVTGSGAAAAGKCASDAARSGLRRATASPTPPASNSPGDGHGCRRGAVQAQLSLGLAPPWIPAPLRALWDGRVR
ncbi:hypothetical protein [Streptomyces sp. 2112.3]|uniref:hypothetical protein n=1 Tax=Streptomyces sp. 2112.3 TaxID=1881023 RepID=UPI000A631CD8|nr:hypothetical protein [Streptomyces sp. 2112.3]